MVLGGIGDRSSRKNSYARGNNKRYPDFSDIVDAGYDGGGGETPNGRGGGRDDDGLGYGFVRRERANSGPTGLGAY